MSRKIFLLLLVISCQLFIYGQNNVTARLRVVRGARLDFIFNTLTKYQNGITYADYSQLNIYFNDTIGGPLPTPGSGWELTMRAIQPNIVGDITAQTLDLETIVVKVKRNGISTGINYNLSTAIQVIASDDHPNVINVNEIILVTYDCGTLAGNRLTNKVADYYFVDIEFNLKKK